MDIYELFDDDSLQIDKEKIHRLYDYINTDLVQNAKRKITLSSVIANKYRGDLYGLLKNEYIIPNSSIMINVIINGYKSSVEYDGSQTIYILEPSVAETVLDMIK